MVHIRRLDTREHLGGGQLALPFGRLREVERRGVYFLGLRVPLGVVSEARVEGRGLEEARREAARGGSGQGLGKGSERSESGGGR